MQTISGREAEKLVTSVRTPEILEPNPFGLSHFYYEESKELKSKILNLDGNTEIIVQAILANKKIAIYGDYDVDGNTSVANQSFGFQQFGYDNFVTYIPNRESEGYGLHRQAIKKLADDGCKLLIVYDTGTDRIDEVDYARSLGMEVVIYDHHQQKSDLIPSNLVNPNQRAQIDLEHRNMSAATLSRTAVLSQLHRLKYLKAENPSLLISQQALDEFDEDYLLLISAIGHYVDVISITDLENRAITNQMLEILNSGKYEVFNILKSLYGIKEFDTNHLAFIIGPFGNAPGRMGDSKLFLNLLSIIKLEDTDALLNEMAKELGVKFEKDKSKDFKYDQLLTAIAENYMLYNEEYFLRLEQLEYVAVLIAREKLAVRTQEYIRDNIFETPAELNFYNVSDDLNERGTFCAEILARAIKAINEERKILSNDIMLPKARADFERQLAENPDLPVLFTTSETYHPGNAGIVASRSKEIFRLPSFVGSRRQKTLDDILQMFVTGSWRSIKGVNLVTLITTLEAMGIKIGGHPMAAGMSYNLKQEEEIIAKAVEVLQEQVNQAKANNKIVYVEELTIAELTPERINQIYANRGPFGPGNEQPLIRVIGTQAISVKRFAKRKSLDITLVDRKDRIGVNPVKATVHFVDGQKHQDVFLSKHRYVDSYDVIARAKVIRNDDGSESVHLEVEDVTIPEKIGIEIEATQLSNDHQKYKESRQKKAGEINDWVKILVQKLEALDNLGNKQAQGILKLLHEMEITLFDLETGGRSFPYDKIPPAAITQLSALKVVKRTIHTSRDVSKDEYYFEELNVYVSPETPGQYGDVYYKRSLENKLTKEALNVTGSKFFRNKTNGRFLKMEVHGIEKNFTSFAEAMLLFMPFSGSNMPVGFNSASFDIQCLTRHLFDILRVEDREKLQEAIKAHGHQSSVKLPISDRNQIGSQELRNEFITTYCTPIKQWLKDNPHIRRCLENPAFATCLLQAMIAEYGELPKNRLDNVDNFACRIIYGLEEQIKHTNFDRRDHNAHSSDMDNKLQVHLASLCGKNSSYIELLQKHHGLKVKAMRLPAEFRYLEEFPMLPLLGDIAVTIEENNPLSKYLKSLEDAHLRSGTEIGGKLPVPAHTRVKESREDRIVLIGRPHIGASQIRHFSINKKDKIIKTLLDEGLIIAAAHFDSTARVDLTLPDGHVVQDIGLSSLRFSRVFLLKDNERENFKRNLEVIKQLQAIENVGAVVLYSRGIRIKSAQQSSSDIDITLPNNKSPGEFLQTNLKFTEYFVRFANIPGVEKAERTLFDEEADEEINKGNYLSLELKMGDKPQMVVEVSKELFEEVILNHADFEGIKSGYFITSSGIRGYPDGEKYILAGGLESFSELYKPLQDTAWLVYRFDRIPGVERHSLKNSILTLEFEAEDGLTITQILTDSHISFDRHRDKIEVDLSLLTNDAYHRSMILKEKITDYRPGKDAQYLVTLHDEVMNERLISYSMFDEKDWLKFFVSSRAHKNVPIHAISTLPMDKTIIPEIAAKNVKVEKIKVGASFLEGLINSLVGSRYKKLDSKYNALKAWSVEVIDDYVSFEITPELLQKNSQYINTLILVNELKSRNIATGSFNSEYIEITPSAENCAQILESFYQIGVGFKFEHGKIFIELNDSAKLKAFDEIKQKLDADYLELGGDKVEYLLYKADADKASEILKTRGVSYKKSKVKNDSGLYKITLNLSNAKTIHNLPLVAKRLKDLGETSSLSKEIELISEAIAKGKLSRFNISSDKVIELSDIAVQYRFSEVSEKMELIFNPELDPIASGTQYREAYNLLDMKFRFSDGAIKYLSADLFYELTKLGIERVSIERIDIDEEGKIVIRLPRIKHLQFKDEYISYFKTQARLNSSVHIGKVHEELAKILNSDLLKLDHSESSVQLAERNRQISEVLKNMRSVLDKFQAENQLFISVNDDKSYRSALFKDTARLNILYKVLREHPEEMKVIFSEQAEEMLQLVKNIRGDIEKAEYTIDRLRTDIAETLKAIKEITLEYELEEIKYQLYLSLTEGAINQELEHNFVYKFIEINPNHKDAQKAAHLALAKFYRRFHNTEAYSLANGHLAVKHAEDLFSQHQSANSEPDEDSQVANSSDNVSAAEDGFNKSTEKYPEKKLWSFAFCAVNGLNHKLTVLLKSLSNIRRLLEPATHLTYDMDKLDALSKVAQAVVDIGEASALSALNIAEAEGLTGGSCVTIDDQGRKYIEIDGTPLFTDQERAAKRLAELNQGKQALPPKPIFIIDTSSFIRLMLTNYELKNHAVINPERVRFNNAQATLAEVIRNSNNNGQAWTDYLESMSQEFAALKLGEPYETAKTLAIFEKTIGLITDLIKEDLNKSAAQEFGRYALNDYGLLHFQVDMAKAGLCDIHLTDMGLAEILDSPVPLYLEDILEFNETTGRYEIVYNVELIREKYPKRVQRLELLAELADAGALKIIRTKTGDEYIEKIRYYQSNELGIDLDKSFKTLFPNEPPLSLIALERLKEILLETSWQAKKFTTLIRKARLRADTGEIAIADYIKELQDGYGDNVDVTILIQGHDVRAQLIKRLNLPDEIYNPIQYAEVNSNKFNPNSSQFEEKYLTPFGSNIKFLTSRAYAESLIEFFAKEQLGYFVSEAEKSNAEGEIYRALKISDIQLGGSTGNNIYFTSYDKFAAEINDVSSQRPFMEFLKQNREAMMELAKTYVIRQKRYNSLAATNENNFHTFGLNYLNSQLQAVM